jgi:4-amino-4-deoxy-L-arabinose transferase-like glycosyltransferase
MTRQPWRHLALVGLLALIAFSIRAASLDAQSLWRDEVDSLRFATFPWPRMLANFTRPGWNGPLYFLVLRGWIALTGSSAYAMRFFSLLFGVLGVPLIYVLGCRLFDRAVGLMAGLLAATSPYLVWYSQEVRMYTLVPALAMLAIYALRRGLEGDGGRWWIVQVVATSLAFYCHILAALLVPVQVMLCVIWWPRAKRHWRGALISLAFLIVPYLPLAAWQVPLAFQQRETGFHPYTLGQMVEILLNGWSLGIVSWGRPWGTILTGALVGGGLVGSWLLGDEKRRRVVVAVAVWLMVPILAVWLVSLRQPLFTDRYLIWTAPAFYLLAAAGLVALWRLRPRMRWLAVVLVGGVLIFNGGNLRRQAVEPIKANFRAAAAYVAEYGVAEQQVPQSSAAPQLDLPFRLYLPFVVAERSVFDELIIFQIPYGRYTFDYYFPFEDYPWADGLYTNHRTPDGAYVMSEREAARRMQELTAGQDVIWLVASEAAMWDERGLVQQWLEENGRCVAEEHFTHVDVYRYLLE